MPVHCNILWDTPEAARQAPAGTMRLAACHRCGLLFNEAFDPALVTYDASYENSLHYSPTFEAYAAALAEDLSARLSLDGKLVVEVGCGKGDFLRRLCRTAGSRGLGIDASYDPTLGTGGADAAIRFVREPFSAIPADLEAALVFCRHVLEHVPDPYAFVSELAEGARRSGSGCRVFIEVPNALYTLRDLGIWDLIYEHCSYFSAASLTRLCERAGLRVERSDTAYGEQFLTVEASPGSVTASSVSEDAVRQVGELSSRFSQEYARKVCHWEQRLEELRSAGKSVALWGAGSKGITFVNTVAGGETLASLVDLNPRKQGRFVPGTGQAVVAPEALTTIRPDMILVMNPLYRDEVGRRTMELGFSCPIEVA